MALVAVYIGFHLLGSLGFGAWGQQLSLGEGLFVLLLAPAFFEPLRELSAVWHDRAAGEAALQALDDMQGGTLPLPGAGVAVTRAATGAAGAGAAPAVTVHGLHFSWPGESTPLFDGYELRIGAGEHVALAGPSGSGKTALLSLLAGLMPATRGEIAIGGVPLTEHTAAALRQRTAWMGQKPHVFAGSVEANVALGRADIGAPEVAEAMRFAALDDVAQAHPGTALGEGGSGLSGGEAVRLALARIAVHPHADLILADEPTAHLDTATAARVADALVALARGRTLIVSTHDPVLAARMDRTVNLGPEPLVEKAA